MTKVKKKSLHSRWATTAKIAKSILSTSCQKTSSNRTQSQAQPPRATIQRNQELQLNIVATIEDIEDSGDDFSPRNQEGHFDRQKPF